MKVTSCVKYLPDICFPSTSSHLANRRNSTTYHDASRIASKKRVRKKTLPSFTKQNPYLPLKRILFFLQRKLPSCPKLHELELTRSGTFCSTDSPKIPWKTQPWNRLGVTALPTFHGLNLPKHPEKQSKKLQNLSQLHPSAHSCYPAAGRRRFVKKTCIHICWNCVVKPILQRPCHGTIFVLPPENATTSTCWRGGLPLTLPPIFQLSSTSTRIFSTAILTQTMHLQLTKPRNAVFSPAPLWWFDALHVVAIGKRPGSARRA